MPRTRTRRLVLEPEAMAELFKPARLELYECLQVAGPASIAELAARVGRPADSLYYHVKKLIEIGVVERRDEARSGRANGRRGRNGAVYGLTARTVSMELDPGSRASREAWAGGAAAILRRAERDVRAALDSGEGRTRGARRNLLVRRLKMRLDAGQLEIVNRHLDAIQEVLAGHAEATEGPCYAVTLALTPLAERARE